MTSNRLHIETAGGNLSEATTYSQLNEHLRLAAEAAYLLGHQRKANGDEVIGSGFLGIGQMLEEVVKNVTKLAMNRSKIQ